MATNDRKKEEKNPRETTVTHITRKAAWRWMMISSLMIFIFSSIQLDRTVFQKKFLSQNVRLGSRDRKKIFYSSKLHFFRVERVFSSKFYHFTSSSCSKWVDVTAGLSSNLFTLKSEQLRRWSGQIFSCILITYHRKRRKTKKNESKPMDL